MINIYSLLPNEEKARYREGNRTINSIKGKLYILLLLCTGIFGWILFFSWTPLLLLISPKLYRKHCDFWGYWWFLAPVIGLRLFFNLHIKITGDLPSRYEKEDRVSVFLSNHTTPFDWMFLWDFFFRQKRLMNEKIVLKGPIKLLPFYGWAIQTLKFFFVERKAEVDIPHLKMLLQSYTQDSYPLQLLIFPEGTINDDVGIASSDRYALKESLPLRRHTLHPKVGGTKVIIDQLVNSGLTSIYDLTIGYPDVLPQPGNCISQGNFPREIHLHIKRYPISSVPLSDEGFAKWLQEIWDEKDRKLKEFNESRKCLHDGSPIQPTADSPPAFSSLELLKITITCLSWVLISIYYYYVLTSFSFSWICLSSLLWFFLPILITKLGGFEKFEVWRQNLSKSKFD